MFPVGLGHILHGPFLFLKSLLGDEKEEGPFHLSQFYSFFTTLSELPLGFWKELFEEQHLLFSFSFPLTACDRMTN